MTKSYIHSAMLNNYFRNIFELRQKYNVGQEIYYSCLTTDFEWFNKIFSIKYIIEPLLLHITKSSIMSTNITLEDKFIFTTLKETSVIRKYILYMELSNLYELELNVYEKIDKSIFVIHKSNFFLDTNYDIINMDFIRLIINTQRELENFDSAETEIVYDDNYEIFKTIYQNILQLYPEEVIKMHDKNV